MRRFFAITVLVAIGLAPAGCTIRYSQSLAGSIPSLGGTEVRSSDSGFSLLYITLSEPTPAHEQVSSLMGACASLSKVEVDYRELFFILFGLPRVTVTGNCQP